MTAYGSENQTLKWGGARRLLNRGMARENGVPDTRGRHSQPSWSGTHYAHKFSLISLQTNRNAGSPARQSLIPRISGGNADSGVRRSRLRNHLNQVGHRNKLACCGISESQRFGFVLPIRRASPLQDTLGCAGMRCTHNAHKSSMISLQKQETQRHPHFWHWWANQWPLPQTSSRAKFSE